MRVLVTGENSYAGKQFYKRIIELNKGWIIDFITVRDNSWRDVDFSIYEAIYHVAAIVHLKERPEMKEIYYKVNRDLTFDLAKKAKSEGVKSFVYLSTIAVYGLIGYIGKDTEISKKTRENSLTYYGKSKLEGEKLLNTLQANNFKVAILRIPMIYGYNSPGNYQSLSNMVKKIRIFPMVNNRRSLIFVDHLSDIVIYLISNMSSGQFLVKNPEDVSTLNMVNEIARNHEIKIYKSSVLGHLIKILGNRLQITRKMFGNIYYKNDDCIIEGFVYDNLSFEESITRSECKEIGDIH